jgi:hypothetical protein
MGYGEFGGGGSVDWEVSHENPGHPAPGTSPGKANGHDSKSIADMGLSKGAPAGHFRVEVMFASPADAAAALTSAGVQGASLVLFVKSNTAVPGGGAKNPPQIRVSW